ncbi:MAG: LLM class flavin-dependent oxidoreductase [Nitrospinaceae bacterium]|jgi:probable F420-dependent oxidoreductase|nr:LLM class flavin-dependent oxidoreductase [Nitrospinaceae bacterium]MBT3820142.1 LLM class flavin-dependent oxidoreductase [Nitrospinaceae bacterium]MBT4429853.1 LLM class flavin-dependent oxidoreductase [Nitrospinaceae bacterium]MBT5366823.1 LLM class flavin-dependent oxidoreductase [Nitrospinaceae bacterium]MBT5946810.1 LLM class flavin-dependent oxidoreductase [Nitrospinaceae bacterium]
MAPPIKFGISWGLHPEIISPPEMVLSIAETVENLGFDSLWMGDHIAFHGGHFTECLTTLAAFAARTTRLTIGTSVYLLPLRTPGVAAKCAATVDYLSGGGRFVFGIGVGGEGKEEFDLCGVPVNERGARTDEAIEIIRKLWTGEKVSHDGRFWSFGETSQSPPPLTSGGPPIWIGGRSDAARKRAALLGDGWVSYLFTAKRFAKGIAQVRQWAEEAGRALDIEGGGWTAAHHAFIYLDDDEARALRTGTEYLTRRYNMNFEDIAEKYLIHGPPGRCAEQLAEFVEAGASHFILRTVGEPETDLEQMTRLAEEVVPKVKE